MMTEYSVFVVRASHVDYDEYDSVTVIAKDEQDAICVADGRYKSKDEDDYRFDKAQYPLKVKRICGTDATSAHVLTASFNAG